MPTSSNNPITRSLHWNIGDRRTNPKCNFCARKSEVQLYLANTPLEEGKRVTIPICMNCAQSKLNIRQLARCTRCESMWLPEAQDIFERCSHCHKCVNCADENHFCQDSFWRSVQMGNFPNFNRDERLTGVEIEVVDKDYYPQWEDLWNHRGDLWHSLPSELGIAHDRSVNSKEMVNGFEVITPPRSSNLEFIKPYITNITKILKEKKYTVNDSCGLHVHFDAYDINGNSVNIARVLRTVYAIEDIIFSMNPQSRWNNHYCQPLWKNYVFDDFNQPMNIEEFENYWYSIGDRRFNNFSRDEISHFKRSKYGHAKYSGVNFHSLLHRGTIEFRYHAGTLSATKIVNWIQFLAALLNYAVYHYDDAHVVELYKTKTDKLKLEKMIQYFSIPNSVAEYMHERVNKFNADFKVYSRDIQKEASALQMTIKYESDRRGSRPTRRSPRFIPGTDLESRLSGLQRAAASDIEGLERLRSAYGQTVVSGNGGGGGEMTATEILEGDLQLGADPFAQIQPSVWDSEAGQNIDNIIQNSLRSQGIGGNSRRGNND